MWGPRAADADTALLRARDLYVRRGDPLSLWVVRSDAVHAVSPDERDPFFTGARHKPYRYPEHFAPLTEKGPDGDHFDRPGSDRRSRPRRCPPRRAPAASGRRRPRPRGQRLCQWITRVPTVEEDMALSNIALDLIGHARTLFTLSGHVDGTGRSEDEFAFTRSDREFANALLTELPGGDFAVTIARQLVYTHYAVLYYEALAGCADVRPAAFGERAAREVTFHRRHADNWTLRLGLGTPRARAVCNGAWSGCGPTRPNCSTRTRWCATSWRRARRPRRPRCARCGSGA